MPCNLWGRHAGISSPPPGDGAAIAGSCWDAAAARWAGTPDPPLLATELAPASADAEGPAAALLAFLLMTRPKISSASGVPPDLQADQTQLAAGGSSPASQRESQVSLAVSCLGACLCASGSAQHRWLPSSLQLSSQVSTSTFFAGCRALRSPSGGSRLQHSRQSGKQLTSSSAARSQALAESGQRHDCNVSVLSLACSWTWPAADAGAVHQALTEGGQAPGRQRSPQPP